MGSVYQENKILINKYKAALDAESKDVSNPSVDVKIIFSISSKDYKIPVEVCLDLRDKVVIEEVGKKIYFCVKPKVSKKFLYNRYEDQSNFENMAFKVFTNSLSKYNTPKSEMEEIVKYLKGKGVTVGSRGSTFPSMDTYDFVMDVRRSPDHYRKALEKYPDVLEILSKIKEVNSADIDLSRAPSIFKSIKNKDVIPVSHFDGDTCILNVPEYSTSSKTSTSFFGKENLSKESSCNGKALKSYAVRSYKYIPWMYWVVPTFNCSFIDQNRFIKYNFGDK